ncbi:MAG: hypothetical protein ACI9EF_000761 [Pseudohongiellaceae bacterium]
MAATAQLVLGLGLWGMALVWPVQAQFVAPEGSDYHNGSSLVLEDEGRGAAWLSRLEQALAVVDSDSAVSVMRSLRGLSEARLLPFGPRTHVPLIDRAAQLIAAQGPGPLLDGVLADARGAIASALQQRDLPTLLDHATRGRALESWREASWAAARLTFEEGRWWEAVSLAERLPPSAASAALIAAAKAQMLPVLVDNLGGPWERASRRYEFPRDGNRYAEALPMVVDGRDGEVLVFDHMGLQGLDLNGTGMFVKLTMQRFDWGNNALEGGELTRVGRPAPRRFTVSRAGQRLVLPFNVASERWRHPRDLREARLLAVDLPDEQSAESPARLAWSTRGQGEPNSAFGEPLVQGDRVFALLYRGGLHNEVSLMAYALADGELLFATPLVRGSQPRRFASRRAESHIDDVDKRAPEGKLVVRHGVVYACTGFGVVAAVDGITGHLQHTFRYDRVFAHEQNVFDPAFLFDSGGWKHGPMQLHGERLVVAPSDSRFLYMLALQPGPQGQLIHEDPIERLDRRDLVALLDDPEGGSAPLVLATRWRDNQTSLVLLGPNGHTLATSVALSENEPQTGRPLLAGEAVVLPTALGLRLFALHDLERPPAFIPLTKGLGAPESVYATRGGLLSLHPQEDGKLIAVYRRSAR